MTFPRYPRYKDSGVEWLGDVPEHWEITAIKRIARLHSGESISSDRVADEGPYPVIGGNGLRGYTTQFTHDGHFPIIGRQGALCGNVNYGVGRFWATEHAVVASPVQPVAILWLGEMLRAMNLNHYSISAAQPGLSVETVGNLRTVYPPLEEQAAIAAFLQSESARIDALIAEQQRLIDLLKEKRQAVISHAVTKGLNPDAPMKPSGVEWLGDIPEHWDVVQSRRLFRVRSEKAWPDDQQLTASQKSGIVFQSDFVELEGRRVVETILGRESLLHVEPDDFVISMRSFQGGLERSTLRGSISFHYVMLTPIKSVYPPFFAHLLKSLQYIQALRATSNLIRDGQELRYSHFVQVPLPVIPLDEQKVLAERIDLEVRQLDQLVAECEIAIGLLKEHRAALISAAVTGKIDVRRLAQADAEAA